MKKTKDNIRLSASDLSNYLSCTTLSQLDFLVVNKKLAKPDGNNPHAQTMQERGDRHEKKYVEKLNKLTKNIVEIDKKLTDEKAYKATLDAMKAGADYIIQAVLLGDGVIGKIDILAKSNSKPSKLGDFHYEVQDTKLSKETKASALMQLCFYNELLATHQDLWPEFFYVVTPKSVDAPEKYRVDDFKYYYNKLNLNLNTLISSKLTEKDVVYPEPKDHCDFCPWWDRCAKILRDDDHLSLVAGITKKQIKILNEEKITTLEKLANIDDKKLEKIDIEPEVAKKIRNQAKIQLEGRVQDEHIHKMLPIVPERGLERLPEPHKLDVYFDLEGDPFAGDRGIEYLFGYSEILKKKPKYHHTWALNLADEKKAFEDFIDQMIDRLKKSDLKFHIYHYSPYEIGAIKRLAEKHTTKFKEFSDLINSGTFVDLYQVVRHGLIASVEKYSIKDLEPFFNFNRQQNLKDVGPHKRALEHALELEDIVDDTDKDVVLKYNEDDCNSTYELHKWLESERSMLVRSGITINRFIFPKIEDVKADENLQTIIDFETRLRGKIKNQDKSKWDNEDYAYLVLSNLIGFDYREKRIKSFEYARMLNLPSEDYLEESSAIGKLNITRSDSVLEAQYPMQEVKLEKGLVAYSPEGVSIGEIIDFDSDANSVQIQLNNKNIGARPHSVFLQSFIYPSPMFESLSYISNEILSKGLTKVSKLKCLIDLLLRVDPDAKKAKFKLIELGNNIPKINDFVLNMNDSYLPIQGPPGAGKTYLAKKIIIEQLKNGKKVGITAVSNKVIDNLLKSVEDELVKCKITNSKIIRKVSKASENKHVLIKEESSYPKIKKLVDISESIVVGGTTWLFGREEFRESFDYLFVDEAGQLSLANIIAIAPSTKNLILLGDPCQLEQPVQALHPEGADQSGLEYILGHEHKTIPPDKGIFLENTWRLAPSICEFISEQFYENKLKAASGNEYNSITSKSKFSGSGLFFEPVEHTGNKSSSIEEVEKVREIIAELLAKKTKYTVYDHELKKAVTKDLTQNDILVMAPYNLQVFNLDNELPEEVKVGTVDRFQGREAPIVIYSMTSSSAEEAPRGMEFLYSENRFNVAVSRAQCLFILVGSPEVFEAQSKTPRQMKLANAYCRYLEMKME